MYYLTKEKTMLVCYDGNPIDDPTASFCGGIEIYTPTYFDRERKPTDVFPIIMQRIASGRVYANTLIPNLDWYLRLFDCKGYCSFYRKYLERYSMADIEKLMSVGLYIPSNENLSEDIPIIVNKDIIQFLRDNYSDEYTTKSYTNYLLYKKASTSTVIPEGYSAVFQEFLIGCTITINEIDTVFPLAEQFFTRAIREHLVIPQYTNHYCGRFQRRKKLKDYVGYTLNICTGLNNMFTDLLHLSDFNWNEYRIPEHNLISEYFRWVEIARVKTTDNIEKNIRKNNDKKWLYWENEEYKAYPLTTAEAFHEESLKQRNCVEGIYMSKVSRGSTHIVTLRKKAKLGVSFITCEVNTKGQIVQFLATCNKRVPKEYEFLRTEYQKYLDSVEKE